MEFTVPLASGISLKFTTGSTSREKYPTESLQKGFLLVHEGQDLSEEGVGFGVPVLKRGMQTIFPGSSSLISTLKDPALDIIRVTVIYQMNLEERIVKPGFESVKSKFLYMAKNFLAALIRRIPPFRGLLTATSNGLRWLFGWQTTYEEAQFCTDVRVVYSIDRAAGSIRVDADTSNLDREGFTEVVVMNEQGANAFDQYCDADGTHQRGDEISCWEKVTSAWASFISTSHRLAFTLGHVQGATIYRGRELVGSRLAWSGFGLSFPPDTAILSYQLQIERLQ